MKKEIHPEYKIVEAKCACGKTFETKSTKTGGINVEICSNCHSFYTGEQKFLDSGGQVAKFKKRFENFESTQTV